MTDRARDPRTARTVASLRSALRESLRDRALDDVSVSELCRIADIRRTTFYTHYSSVADLLTDMLATGVDEPLDLVDTSGMSVAKVAELFQDTLIASFDVVTHDRELFRVAFGSAAGTPMRRALTDAFRRRLEIAFSIWAEHGAALDVNIPVATVFAAGGLAAAVEGWAISDDEDATVWANAVRDQMAPWWPRGEGADVTEA